MPGGRGSCQPALATYEIRDGLDTISFKFKAEDEDRNLTGFSEKVLKELEEMYGEPEKLTQMKQEGWCGYRWISTASDGSVTSLQVLTYAKGDIIDEVLIAVGVMPEKFGTK